ncbi:MAG TPA: RMD1 family protein [Lacipirellulaceae bacterium]|nr:RMD1 family protein [Lacipirellulaceae bacterium]
MSTGDRPVPIALTHSNFLAHAVYVGEQINLRSLVQSQRIFAQQPATIGIEGGGITVLYRYGAAVFFDVTEDAKQRFLRQLFPLVSQIYERPETEEVRITVNPQAREGVEGGAVVVKDASTERLQVVAAALAKSVALAQYERDIAGTFDRIEPFAVQLERSGRPGRYMRPMLRHIGQALLNEQKMVARVEVIDRPEILWDRPDLEQLYLRLEDEFELRERMTILDHKLELISRTVGTTLDLLQKRRSSRLEWYIVALFLVEIALSVYDIFVRHG